MKLMYRTISIAVILIVALCSVSRAQDVDYKFHSVFIYNFTKYIKWPDAAMRGDFVIGVVGDSEIVPHLKDMASSRNVNGKKIVVKVFPSLAMVTECHMLFLPEKQSKDLGLVRKQLEGKPTLLISEKPGLGKKGSSINFVINNGRWNFEVNHASIEQQNLKISTELTKFAVTVFDSIENG